MVYTLNYNTQEEVEQNESVSSVSIDYGHEIRVHYEGDVTFDISGDTFVVMKGDNYPFIINMDNPLPLVDYHTTFIDYIHIKQPIEIYNPEVSDGFYGLVKFEATSEEPVVINYPIGSGRYNAINGIEGTLKLGGGTEYERVYLTKGATSSYVCFFKFDREESGNIYVGDFYAETHYIPTPNVDGYKVTSVVPGVAYCQENDTVLYNDTWNSVTLVYPGLGIEKQYKTNFVTFNQLRDDFTPGSSRYPYIRSDEGEGKYFITVPLSDAGNSGYVFFKESDGMTFEVTDEY
jgi:hypothetical protein